MYFGEIVLHFLQNFARFGESGFVYHDNLRFGIFPHKYAQLCFNVAVVSDGYGLKGIAFLPCKKYKSKKE